MPSIDDAPPRPQPRRPSPGTQLPAPARPPLPASVLRGTFWNPISGNCSDASPVLGPLAPQRLRLRKPRCGCCGTPTSLPGLPGRCAGPGCLPPRIWVPSAPVRATGYGLRAPPAPSPVLPAWLPRGGASLSTPSALPGDAASARPGRRCRRLSSSPSRA